MQAHSGYPRTREVLSAFCYPAERCFRTVRAPGR
jgi:hypothetical protein